MGKKRNKESIQKGCGSCRQECRADPQPFLLQELWNHEKLPGMSFDKKEALPISEPVPLRFLNGGTNWIRTSDPHDVNVIL
jgi:hypothetical protein